MGIINLTPDSFLASSRATTSQALSRIEEMSEAGADIVDLGAVSTRPGADEVSIDEEWRRLSPVLRRLREGVKVSIDTTSSEIVRRAYDLIGGFIVNDISAGEDDPVMLRTVAELHLPYVAMHKRGNPRTMDSLTGYEDGVMEELRRYFEAFSLKASSLGIDDWILDPGLGFAKTDEQNWEILEHLESLKSFRKSVLVGAADKRFTKGDTEGAHRLAIKNGADILRVHDVSAAVETVKALSLQP